MSWRTVGSRFDDKVGDIAERATRQMTRRQAVRTAVIGGATGLGALTIGVEPALASCASNCGPTPRCSSCPSNGCPSGYSLCKGCSTCNCFNNYGYRCEWPSGYWIACNSLGHGYGYDICYDCISGGNCSGWCTCLSSCICCQCLAPADVIAEQKRIQHFAAAMN
jgi:hypothetical protein